MIFVREPGTYKIIWDNSFSWFTGKTIRYRITIMKPLSELDINRRVDYELLRQNINKDLKNQNIRNEVEMQVLGNPNNANENLINSNSSNSNTHEEKKFLMVKFEGKERAYETIKMQKKEKLMEDKEKYFIMSVLLTQGKIRIYDPERILITESITESKIESNTESNTESIAESNPESSTESITESNTDSIIDPNKDSNTSNKIKITNFVRSETNSEFLELDMDPLKNNLDDVFEDDLQKLFAPHVSK